MKAKVKFTLGPEDVTIDLHGAMLADGSTGQYTSYPTHTFVVPNEEIAGLLQHVLGLAKKPKAASKSGLKVGKTTSYFDAFWDLYPHVRRVARAQMQVKWAANNLDAEWPVIERHLQLMMPTWAKDQYKFCPLATTYLNQRRWEAIAEEIEPKIV